MRFSIIINGCPQGFFASSRGLRQGDPLSSLLFVLVMETLSRLMDRAIGGGYISGFSVGPADRTPMMISHLLFADDTLLFCNADQHQLEYLHAVFSWFEAVLGLKINLSKSEMVHVGNVPHIRDLVEILSCKVSALPMTYLGLPLGARFNSVSIWDPILEKMERRLAGWKRLYLSKGGKLTLLKSTLSNLPTYFLSLFHLPAGVAAKIERIQRNFLWSGWGDSHSVHLVKWNIICDPIQNEGLGVKNLRRFNQALLGKWLWRDRTDWEALWRQIVEAKYGEMWGGWCSDVGKGPYGVSLWKYIRRGWDHLFPFLSFKVGNEEKVWFWHDIWCGDRSLRVVYPGLFSIAGNRDASVANLMSYKNGVLHWELTFACNVHDWEMNSMNSLMELIYFANVVGNGVDTLCWQQKSKGGFTMKSFYQSLSPSPSRMFPWKGVWKPKVPPRVAFFLWVTVLGKILTAENLRKRNIIIVSWCCMCKTNGESIDHLFIHCPVARELWNAVFCTFGVLWVMS